VLARLPPVVEQCRDGRRRGIRRSVEAAEGRVQHGEGGGEWPRI
jgi:hypothetical protein